MSSAIKDWLDSIGVEYKQHGTDVGINDLNIDCPWCGKEKHLGIHRKNGWINCWACRFEGIERKPWLGSLVAELESLPYSLAKAKAQQLIKDSQADDYSQHAELFANPTETWLPPTAQPFFSELRSDLAAASQQLARSYLNERSFSDRIIAQHKMLFTTVDPSGSDPWRGRVLVPFFESGVLVSWVGRDYTGCASQRYRNCPAQQSIQRIKRMLYGYEEFKQQRLRHARIVEGVFDKITLGPSALAVSKGGHSTEQLLLLSKLSMESASVIFDPTTFDDRYSLLRAVALAKELSAFVPRVKVVRLTEGDCNELGCDRVLAAEARSSVFQA